MAISCEFRRNTPVKIRGLPEWMQSVDHHHGQGYGHVQFHFFHDLFFDYELWWNRSRYWCAIRHSTFIGLVFSVSESSVNLLIFPHRHPPSPNTYSSRCIQGCQWALSISNSVLFNSYGWFKMKVMATRGGQNEGCVYEQIWRMGLLNHRCGRGSIDLFSHHMCTWFPRLTWLIRVSKCLHQRGEYTGSSGGMSPSSA